MSDRELGEIAGVEGGERGEEEAGFSGRVDRKSGGLRRRGSWSGRRGNGRG